jgi:hypothetical protein
VANTTTTHCKLGYHPVGGACVANDEAPGATASGPHRTHCKAGFHPVGTMCVANKGRR